MFQQDVELLLLKSLSLQKHSTDTLVDSGFYRAGEAVDNVSEFYRPASDYVTYQVSYNSSSFIIIAIIQLFKIIPMSYQCHYRTLV